MCIVKLSTLLGQKDRTPENRVMASYIWERGHNLHLQLCRTSKTGATLNCWTIRKARTYGGKKLNPSGLGGYVILRKHSRGIRLQQLGALRLNWIPSEYRFDALTLTVRSRWPWCAWISCLAPRHCLPQFRALRAQNNPPRSGRLRWCGRSPFWRSGMMTTESKRM